ncbi:hypothetical protein QYM36_015681 [Artemia franciscana]|uniref:Uncharacterized protein n=1 Tax=Artemia franciscana TaxID=6661 RepID=A0AA88H9U9_ARTSF|nr:hypothetical protein QYM36_015681 [Artemia franciscana]
MQAWKPVRNKFEIESGPENECSFKADVRDLCQRCAKVTRSRHVYPKCCNHNQKSIYQDRGVSLGVRDWCDNFLNFGIA